MAVPVRRPDGRRYRMVLTNVVERTLPSEANLKLDNRGIVPRDGVSFLERFTVQNRLGNN